jgi:hypothetical protein
MKRLLHTPGLLLIAFCGVFCGIIGWERADDWLFKQYSDLEERCR